MSKNNNEVNICSICFNMMIAKSNSLFTTNEDFLEFKQQYSRYLHKRKFSDQDIYEALLLNRIINDDEKLDNIKNYYDNAQELECYEYYNKYDPHNMFCRVCPECIINNNQFAEEETKILQMAMYAPANIDYIASLEEDGPIFNSVVADEFFMKNKKSGISPTFVLPFTRLYFDRVLVGKMPINDFIESIDSEYGSCEEARECAANIIDGLELVVSTLNRVPLTKPSLKKIVSNIHSVFGRTTKFPPLGCTWEKPMETKSKTSTFASLSLSGEDDCEHTITKDDIMQIVGKDVAIIKGAAESETGDVESEDNKSEHINNDDNVSLEEQSGVGTTTAPTEEKQPEISQEKTYKPCVIKPYINLKTVKLISLSRNIELVSQFCGELKELKYCICEYVGTDDGDAIIFFSEKHNRFYVLKLNDEYASGLVLNCFKNRKFCIYTAMPWHLSNQIYKTHKIILNNVKSVYVAYTMFNKQLEKISLEQIINESTNQEKKQWEDVVLYCIRNYKKTYDFLYDKIENTLSVDDLDSKERMNVVYGISYDRDLICNGGDKLVSMDGNGIVKVFSGVAHLSVQGVLFQISIKCENKALASEILLNVINDFVISGNYKKCPFRIASMSNNNLFGYVVDEDMYVFVFDLIVFFAKKLCMKRKLSCNVEIKKLN